MRTLSSRRLARASYLAIPPSNALSRHGDDREKEGSPRRHRGGAVKRRAPAALRGAILLLFTLTTLGSMACRRASSHSSSHPNSHPNSQLGQSPGTADSSWSASSPQDPQNLRGHGPSSPRPGSDDSRVAHSLNHPPPKGGAARLRWADIERATNSGRPGYLLRQLQPVAYRPQGRFLGWQIQSLFPDDPKLCDRGCFLQVGDVIVSVNGSTLERPEAFAAAFEQLPELNAIQLRILRNGRLIDRVFGIENRPAPRRPAGG